MENFAYYVFLVIAAIVAVFVLKKVAGCLMKTIFLAVIVAVLLAIYFLYFKGYAVSRLLFPGLVKRLCN